MLFFNVILYILFCNWSMVTTLNYKFSSKNLKSHKTKTNHKKKDLSNLTPNVESVSFAFACSAENICFKIENFKIDPEYVNDCYDERLPIYFRIVSVINNETEVSFGYLHSNGIIVDEFQKTTNICKRIKR